MNDRSLTRRAALGLMIGGGALTASETLGFTNLEASRGVSVAAVGDLNAILGLSGPDGGTGVNDGQSGEAYTNPHVVDLVNNTDSDLHFEVSRISGTEVIVVEDANDATTFSDSISGNIDPIAPGESFPITLFHRNTGTIEDEEFNITVDTTVSGLSIDLDRWVRINDPVPNTSDASGLGLFYDGLYGVAVQTSGGTVASDGAAVTGWNDKGPLTGGNLGLVENEPTYADVGTRALENVVEFNPGLNAVNTLAGAQLDLTGSNDVEITLFALMRNPDGGAAASLFEDTGGTADRELSVVGGGDLLTDDVGVLFNYDNSEITYSDTISSGQPVVVVGRITANMDGSGNVNSIEITARVDGAQVGSTTDDTVASDYVFSNTLSVGIGGRQSSGTTDSADTSRAYTGEVAEVLTYDVALSDTEIQQLEQYLYTKWSGL